MTIRYALLFVLLPLATAGCRKAQASPEPLVVHEWGTFTSFQGEGGVSLEGMQHETEALPPFVHSRLDPRTSPLALYGDTSRDVPVRGCRGKMETPVIYFHTKSRQRVQVHVDFAGLLTQWYPAASGASPPFVGREKHDLEASGASSLDWDLDLLPRADVPEVSRDSDWHKAREVDAAFVRSHGEPGEAEKYVFYRGLMRQVTQPLVYANGGGAFTVVNATGSPLRAAFAIDMREHEGRFEALGEVSGVQSLTLDAPLRPKADVTREIESAVQAALVGDGLYEDEARAMVRTWSETWFQAEGTRVLYLVPRAVTDATLPLRITPEPEKLVRTLVGRVEVLTPERRELVTRAVRDGDDRGLARFGRFAEPAVRDVMRSSTDDETRAAAVRALARLSSLPLDSRLDTTR